MRSSSLILFGLLLFTLFDASMAGTKDPFGWDAIPRSAYPGAYWWWHGSAVNEKELERNISELASVGIKTLRLNAIYKGEDSNLPTIDYLTDDWNQMARQTLEICRTHGVQLDLWGNGWPFGGNWIQPDYAA